MIVHLVCFLRVFLFFVCLYEVVEEEERQEGEGGQIHPSLVLSLECSWNPSTTPSDLAPPTTVSYHATHTHTHTLPKWVCSGFPSFLTMN